MNTNVDDETLEVRRYTRFNREVKECLSKIIPRIKKSRYCDKCKSYVKCICICGSYIEERNEYRYICLNGHSNRGFLLPGIHTSKCKSCKECIKIEISEYHHYR